MNAKGFFSSKTNWFGILIFILGGLNGLSGSEILEGDAQNVVVMAVGIVTIVLRTFFTSGPIKTSSK